MRLALASPRGWYIQTVLTRRTADEVIVDHAYGLHKGVNDGRAAKFEAFFLEILGYLLAEIRLGWDLIHRGPLVHQGIAIQVFP